MLVERCMRAVPLRSDNSSPQAPMRRINHIQLGRGATFAGLFTLIALLALAAALAT
jgi:hypothetical protein